MEGVVKSYARNRGFGFITTEGGDEVFVHHSDIAEEGREYLTPGQGVRFGVAQSPRGPRAVKVHVTREVPLDKERHLDWRGRRRGHPRAGEVPKTALRARGLLPEEDEEDEEESSSRNPDSDAE